MTLLRHFKRVFRKLTPTEVAATELAEAELQRLQSQSGQEWAQAMCDYHARRIARLRAFLATQAETGDLKPSYDGRQRAREPGA